MEPQKKNLEASIYSRLKNVAKQRKRPVQEVLPIAFLESFYDNSFKKEKWNAFLKNITYESISLKKIMTDLKGFFEELALLPIN